MLSPPFYSFIYSLSQCFFPGVSSFILTSFLILLSFLLSYSCLLSFPSLLFLFLTFFPTNVFLYLFKFLAFQIFSLFSPLLDLHPSLSLRLSPISLSLPTNVIPIFSLSLNSLPFGFFTLLSSPRSASLPFPPSSSIHHLCQLSESTSSPSHAFHSFRVPLLW